MMLGPLCGEPTVRWGRPPRCFPNRLRANIALGIWHKEASTDRSSFEAHRGLTQQEAASSTNCKKEALSYVANNGKRSLTTGGLIEALAAMAKFSLSPLGEYSMRSLAWEIQHG